jgi:hypothetical protein
MFFVFFVLLFYIVHWCIDIEDRSLSGLYFNKIILNLILSYSILSFSNMTIAIGIISIDQTFFYINYIALTLTLTPKPNPNPKPNP